MKQMTSFKMLMLLLCIPVGVDSLVTTNIIPRHHYCSREFFLRSNRQRPYQRAIASAQRSLFHQLESPYFFIKQRLGLTFIKRKRTQQALRSVRTSVTRQCRNFSHGALHVIGNFYAVVLYTVLPSTLCKVAVQFSNANLFSLYRLHWIALNSLFFLSEVYHFAAEAVCRVFGVPAAVLALWAISLGRMESMRAIYTLFRTTFKSPEELVDLSITCIFAPIQEEVHFRLIPGLIVAELARRRIILRNARLPSLESKFHCGIFSFFSILFGAAHIGNRISLGTTLAETSLSTVLSATGAAVSSGLFAAHSLVPLYRRRGLAAAVGAHAAWNTLVCFGNGELIKGLFLCTALARLIRNKRIFNQLNLKRQIG